MFRIYAMLQDEAGEGGAGAAGAPDTAKLLSDMKAQNDALLKRLDALEKKNGAPPAPGEPSDLAARAEKIRLEKEKQNTNQTRVEAAMRFDIGGKDWAKTNSSLLPKTIDGIFVEADKEKYGSVIEKEQAIKTGIISEFFALQTNLDLLTESQKSALAEFKALTKTDKEDRAAQIYESIFEPTFEMLKRIKKAEQVNKGFANPTDSEAAYVNKMIEKSRSKHLRKEK